MSDAGTRATGLQFLLNGAPRPWDASATIARLLQDLGLTGQRLAVERNGMIVPKSAYAEVFLEPGDRLEIVRAVGGG